MIDPKRCGIAHEDLDPTITSYFLLGIPNQGQKQGVMIVSTMNYPPLPCWYILYNRYPTEPVPGTQIQITPPLKKQKSNTTKSKRHSLTFPSFFQMQLISFIKHKPLTPLLPFHFNILVSNFSTK